MLLWIWSSVLVGCVVRYLWLRDVTLKCNLARPAANAVTTYDAMQRCGCVCVDLCKCHDHFACSCDDAADCEVSFTSL